MVIYAQMLEGIHAAYSLGLECCQVRFVRLWFETI